ncbi:hypothetical protein [Corynebacterium glucuronolyticum]|uniref:Pentapeptide repeat-containing protein n=1 Tax=Corynebacterium glucuronolyticum TaxID=39791 RepID=A0A7T4JVS0_9CORY|nr:hypothetical protein [Corynebacterium glucuronolyticum]EEI25865.1 hypothetical protein HMPREF0294_2525 [Corynebacterium glucuronolyticum ATCC 51867]MCT1442071.1 hypothetical protein [Corynebacterium glucuronolyticum]MCT1564541.1 hypothetical protein [Corynebacterium glucuronolyticum]QQB47207.1 hypothetical protein I6I10_04685 [Corynebacterium glucuronolyticum]QQU88865.1 hypothetical protein I6I68_02445 [Corynebacterium glucuronolyticum]
MKLPPLPRSSDSPLTQQFFVSSLLVLADDPTCSPTDRTEIANSLLRAISGLRLTNNQVRSVALSELLKRNDILPLNLCGADLRQIAIEAPVMDGIDCRNMWADYLILSHATVTRCNFSGTKFYNGVLTGTYIDCDFTKTDFLALGITKRSTFFNCSFLGSTFDMTSFGPATVRNCAFDADPKPKVETTSAQKNTTEHYNKW